MKTLRIVALLALLAPVAGCDQNKMMDPEVPAAIYFDWGSSAYRQKETFNMTFAFQADTTWNYLYPLNIIAMGPLYDVDRPIGLMQVPEADHNAVPLPSDKDITETKAYLYGQAVKRGEVLNTPEKVEAATAAGITAHYVGFDHPKLMEYMRKYTVLAKQSNLPVYYNTSVPGGYDGASFPVILLKDPDMNTFTSTAPAVEPGKPLRIHVKVKANENFVPGIYDHDVPGRNTDFTLSFTNEMAPPLKWATYWKNQFNSWGPVKFQFLRDATGFTDWEMTNTPDLSLDQLGYMRNQTNELIKAYNARPENKDKPLREPVVEGQPYSGKLVTNANASY